MHAGHQKLLSPGSALVVVVCVQHWPLIENYVNHVQQWIQGLPIKFSHSILRMEGESLVQGYSYDSTTILYNSCVALQYVTGKGLPVEWFPSYILIKPWWKLHFPTLNNKVLIHAYKWKHTIPTTFLSHKGLFTKHQKLSWCLMPS